MFRLHRERTALATTLRLAGRLDATNAATVAAMVDDCLRAGHRLVLDLAGLQFADAEGVRCLQRARRVGAQLVHGSTFLRHLLETPA